MGRGVVKHVSVHQLTSFPPPHSELNHLPTEVFYKCLDSQGYSLLIFLSLVHSMLGLVAGSDIIRSRVGMVGILPFLEYPQ